MKTVYSDDHRHQDGRAGLIDGKLMPCFEMPRRADMIHARVREVGLGEVLAPREFGVDPVKRVHKPNFVEFLRGAWDLWVKQHGAYDALPLNWAARGMRAIEPEAIDGKLSYYSFDAGTPITAGTWRAITASANVALTGQAMVAAGESAVFSLCRPPGHHAGSDFYGGYCFLNNAAAAGQAFLDCRAPRNAILDVDYHHVKQAHALRHGGRLCGRSPWGQCGQRPGRIRAGRAALTRQAGNRIWGQGMLATRDRPRQTENRNR